MTSIRERVADWTVMESAHPREAHPCPRTARVHDRLHRYTDPGCDMCMDRENES